MVILHPKQTYYPKCAYYPIIIYHPFLYKFPISFYYPRTKIYPKYTYYSITIYDPFSYKYPKSLNYRQIALHPIHTFLLSNMNFPSYSPQPSYKHILSQMDFVTKDQFSYFSFKHPKSLYYPQITLHPIHSFLLFNINFPSCTPKPSYKHILSQIHFLSNNHSS